MKREPFKMWANTEEEARSILNYMYSIGGEWGVGEEPVSATTYGGFYFNSFGDGFITCSGREDRKYFDEHQSKEFFFATPVELGDDDFIEGFTEVKKLAGHPELSQKDVQVADNVNNPKHYTSHPSGIECIDITRHMGFNLGNATKYIWRCDLKKDAIEDLRKAIFYLNDEIELRLKDKK